MELIKINLSSEERFDAGKYPADGIYLNENTEEIFLRSKKLTYVVYLATLEEVGHLFETKQEQSASKEQKGNNLSEDFVLKLVSLITAK